MGFGHGEPDDIAGALALVSHERRTELFDQRRPVDVEGDGELAWRVAFDHLAIDVQRTVRRVHDVRTANLQIDLNRIAEEIFPGELRRCQRLPDLLRRRCNVDGVDGSRLEMIDVHLNPSMSSAAGGIVSALPVSSRLLRLARIAGHPLEMPSRSLLPASKSSWVSVSFTTLPCGARVKTTLVGRSLRAASLSTWWNV